VQENQKPDQQPDRKSVQQNLGVRIRDLRKKKLWSKKKFADLCGVYPSHIDAIERGKVNITLETMISVAANLDITISSLFTGIA
jgi:transcriptional regulator with XRE-family HTH domain